MSENTLPTEIKKSFFNKYKYFFVLITCIIIGFLVLTIYESTRTSNHVEQIVLTGLKQQLDNIEANQAKTDSSIVKVDLKIDKTTKELAKSKSTINNIYNKSIYEKTELNKATDTTNIIYFHNYINNYISPDSKNK